MSKTFSIQLQGSKEIQEFLKKADDKIKDNISQAMADIKNHMISEIKLSIAGQSDEVRRVDTGNYLNSITGYSDMTGAVIASDIEYAPYVEEGTSRMVPGRHFQNSLARNQTTILQFMENKVKEATNG